MFAHVKFNLRKFTKFFAVIIYTLDSYTLFLYYVDNYKYLLFVITQKNNFHSHAKPQIRKFNIFVCAYREIIIDFFLQIL